MKDRKFTTRLKRSGWLLLLASLLVPATSWAALDAYLTLVGETQGAIQGDVSLSGKENTIKVVGFGHNVSQVLDAATGLPSGKRVHRPLRIVKEIDRSTPILLSVLNSDEELTTFQLRFYRTNQGGAEEQFYTIELIGAHIVSLTPSHSSDLPDSLELDPDPMYETVTFTYDRLILTWETGGITGESTWVDPRP